MYTAAQFVRLISSTAHITIKHDGKTIEGVVPKYLLKATKYANHDKILLEDSGLYCNTVIDDYICTRLHFLKEIGSSVVLPGQDDNFLAYSSLVRLCRLLEDEDCLYELVDQLFWEENKSMFDDILNLFTTEELWMEFLMGGCDLDMSDQNMVKYVTKLHSNAKYYRKHLFAIFSVVNKSNALDNLPEEKELRDDLREYILLNATE